MATSPLRLTAARELDPEARSRRTNKRRIDSMRQQKVGRGGTGLASKRKRKEEGSQATASA